MISVVNLKFCIVGYCNCKSEAQVKDIIIRLKNKPFRETKSTVSYVLKTNDWIGQELAMFYNKGTNHWLHSRTRRLD